MNLHYFKVDLNFLKSDSFDLDQIARGLTTTDGGVGGRLRGRRLLRLAGRHMLGVGLDAEQLTQVLTAAGYEVAADSGHNIDCSVIARLAPAG
ncbi:hypothetical protein [Nonomuraea sp. NPDC049709]|uniref:hypothetical protein n=1 Tax=Nonomuraea sp. NPDC049709 TaxID=3154736 RepID=UPI00342AAF20